MQSTKLKAVLIDDELKALTVLSHLLSHTQKVEIVASETNPNLGLRQVVIQKPDVVFLDIDMPNKDGITLLKEIIQLDIPVRVVMVSAFDNYIFEAFKSSAVDFLVKPIVVDELISVVNRLQSTTSNSNIDQVISKIEETNRIKISSGGKTLLLEPNHILFITADGNYSTITLINGKEHFLTLGIGKLETQLTNIFFRINRSTIINTQHLSGLVRRKRTCILTDGEQEFKFKASGTKFYELESICI